MSQSKAFVTRSVSQVADTIRSGQVVACPTEAVWGLSCDPFDSTAVESLLTLKQRERAKGLIVVGASTECFQALLAHLPQAQRDQVEASWPGPYTWLLPDPEGVFSPWVKGDHVKIACRVSRHSPLQALAEASGGLIVSTSANRAGEPPFRDLEALSKSAIADSLGAILEAPLGGQAEPTQIRDGESGNILRASK